MLYSNVLINPLRIVDVLLYITDLGFVAIVILSTQVRTMIYIVALNYMIFYSYVLYVFE